LSYPLTALISDLHGNLPALEVALADARERGVRRFVCLGDVVGYGAEPRPCLDLVMELCVAGARDPALPGRALEDGLCLLGNHEQALLLGAEDFNPKARAAIDWTRDDLLSDPERGDSYWEFLDALAPSARDERAMYAHGSPRDPVREYLLPRDARNAEKLADNFDRMDRGVCFVGHSHVPAIYYRDGRLFRPRDTVGPFDLGDLALDPCIVNVGSVGQPRDGDPRLSYVLWDGATVTFVRLEYPWQKAAHAIRAVSALPSFLAERLALGK